MKTSITGMIAGTRFQSAAAGVALIFLLTSCPNPIPISLAAQITDGAGPVITITAPAEGASYGSTVLVTGTITDDGGSIQSVRVSVPATGLNETIAVAEDGSFSHSFSTREITETILVTVTGVDWNGNSVSLTRTLFNDGFGPNVVITEPADLSPYGTVVRVSGRITDAATSTTTDEVSAASYSVPGTDVAGEIAVGDDGSFSFQFATKLPGGSMVIDGPATIQVKADDWNGNETVATVSIVRAATGDISGFTVTPGNARVTVGWEPVLGADSYTVFESMYGQARIGVSSPYVWDGLDNGEIYAFQVKADLLEATGEDAYSTTISSMPLSTRSLAPWTSRIGYRSIGVEWKPNPNVAMYTVERSLAPNGPWEIRRNLTANSFVDDRVDMNTAYYYRVTPAEYRDIASEFVGATPSRFNDVDLFEVLATADIGGTAYCIDAQGPFAYLATQTPSERFVVVDVSDPANPYTRGEFEITGTENPYGITVSGSYAYVGMYMMGLLIVDISDPDNPYPVATYNTDGYAMDTVIAGDFAYVADSHMGVTILDITDPTNPQFKASLDTVPNTTGIEIVDHYLYVTAYDSGLIAMDIVDPDDPVPNIVGSAVTNWAQDVAVSGGYAYVADGNWGLKILDIATDPTTPAVVGSIDSSGNAQDVFAVGTNVFLGDKPGGLRVYDASVPSSPVLIGTADLYAAGVTIIGPNAYVSSGNEIAVVDVARPTDPVLRGDAAANDRAWNVVMRGDYAYVADYNAGLTVFDVSDVDGPIKRGSVTGGRTYDVAISGNHAIIGAGTRCAVVDISDADNPWIIGSVETSTDGRFVAAAGPTAYLAGLTQGLAVVDISDPEVPVKLGAYETTDRCEGIGLYGSYVVMSVGQLGVRMVDVSDPSAPVVVGNVIDHTTPFNGGPVAVDGNYAYVGEGWFGMPGEGIAVIDISDPANPQVVGSLLDMGTPPWRITIAGSYAYVSLQASGVRIVDISDPTTPKLVGSVTTRDQAFAVSVSGSVACVADSNSGITMVDLLNAP